VAGKVTVIRGGLVKRVTRVLEALVPEEGCQYSVVIMSYESMARSLEVLTSVDWDLVALDEAHFIKRPSTQRTQAAMKIRDSAKRRRLLTGTPVSNSPLDLFAQLEFLGAGWSGFRSWENFREFYGVFQNIEGTPHQKLVAIQNKPFLQERLARLSFTYRKDEALPDLPQKVYDTCEVEMTGPQAEAYEKVAEQLLLEIENDMDESGNKSLTINNILTKLLRLAQIACGYVVWDAAVDPMTLETVREKSLEWFTPDQKLDALVEILREKSPAEKTIVWSCFVPCIRAIHERLEKEGIDHVMYYGSTSEADRLEAERRFNLDPACRVFVGNPGAGGVGLNLPGSDPSKWGTPEDLGTDADHVIYYAQDWSYVKRAQSEDRNHGKNRCRKQVRVTDLVVPDTIDEEIRVRVLKKKMAALELSDIREILEAVLRGVRS
jgi:SNF2 family DNA or RNA helicase